jgi:hypothetical protein
MDEVGSIDVTYDVLADIARERSFFLLTKFFFFFFKIDNQDPGVLLGTLVGLNCTFRPYDVGFTQVSSFFKGETAYTVLC